MNYQEKELKVFNQQNITIDMDVKPVLKWVGGKRQLIPDIREFYKDLSPNKYVEPFFCV